MVMKWNLKCETSLVAERPETRQHFFYFFTVFGSPWKGAPPRKGARFHVFTVVCSFSRRSRIDVRCSVALRVCLARAGGRRCPQRVGSNAALPPDICAFSESLCHRLEDKPIHLHCRRLRPITDHRSSFTYPGGVGRGCGLGRGLGNGVVLGVAVGVGVDVGVGVGVTVGVTVAVGVGVGVGVDWGCN
jgi:hypothetical protein